MSDASRAAPARHDSPRRFAHAARQATAPLLLWALHFFALYAVVAAACLRGWADVRWAGWPALNVGLLAFSAVILAAQAALLAHALRGLRETLERDAVVPALRLGGAVLGLVGVLWQCVPLLAMTARCAV